MYNPQTDVIAPMDQAIEALEKGLHEEALLHLNMARTRAYSVMVASDHLLAPQLDGTVTLCDNVTRFEVIDYGNAEGARCFTTHTIKGGELQIQDKGRTAKLFIRSGESGKD